MQEQFITITDARKEIFAISKEVFKKNKVFTLTEHGLPRVILLSPRKYAQFQKKQKPTLATTIEKSLARILTPYTTARVHDITSGPYDRTSLLDVPTPRGDVNKLANAQRLATAQLYVKLVDIYRYPPEQLHLDTCVRTGGQNSNHTIDIDVLITDPQGNPIALCLTAPFQKYEEWKMRAFRDLFELRHAIKKEYHCATVRHLVYFSHTIGQEKNEEYWTVVDAQKFSKFSEWKKGEYFSEKIFPRYEK